MFQDSRFLIEILVRWANENLVDLIVQKRGHETRGLILLRQNLGTDLVRLWVQENDEAGSPTFRQRFEQDQTFEQADAYVERELIRDDDLWIVVCENSDGVLPKVLESAKPF